jgi:hypothetical protein
MHSQSKFHALHPQKDVPLLQELLKMKLSSGKLQFWEWKKTPVGAATFCPSPILVFYIPP